MFGDIILGLLSAAVILVVIGGVHWWYTESEDPFVQNGIESEGDYEHEDDYFSDIQDAVTEGDEVLEGQGKLWETSEFDAIKAGPVEPRKPAAPLSKAGTVPPMDWATVSEPAAELDPLPQPLVPATDWWDSMPQEHQDALVDSFTRLQAALNTPLSVEKSVPQVEQPQPVSVAPEAAQPHYDTVAGYRSVPEYPALEAEDFTGQFEFILDKHDRPELYEPTDKFMADYEDELALWATQQKIARKQWLAEMGLSEE